MKKSTPFKQLLQTLPLKMAALHCIALAFALTPAYADSEIKIHDQNFIEAAKSRHFQLFTPPTQGSDPAIQDSFLPNLEAAYEKLIQIFPDPAIGEERDKSPIAVVFPGEEFIQGLKFKTELNLVGLHDPAIDEETKRDTILITHKNSAQDARVYFAIHELVHLFLSKNHVTIDLWMNEGLATLFASLATRGADFDIEPLVATHEFLNAKTQRPLLANDQKSFKMQDYGQSYLFFKFIFDRYGGEDLLKALILTPKLDPQSLLAKINQLNPKRTVRTFEDLVLEFVQALAVGPWNYRMASQSPLKGILPSGLSFAVVSVSTSPGEGFEFELIDPSAKIRRFLVEYQEDGRAQIVRPGTQESRNWSAGIKKIALVLLNLTESPLEYEVKISK